MSTDVATAATTAAKVTTATSAASDAQHAVNTGRYGVLLSGRSGLLMMVMECRWWRMTSCGSCCHVPTGHCLCLSCLLTVVRE